MDEISTDSLFEFFLKKHKELEEKTVIHEDDILMRQDINNRLRTYPGDRGWAITEYHISLKTLKERKRAYKKWQNGKIIEARTALKAADAKLKETPRWLIDATINERWGDENDAWEQELDELESRASFFEGFKDVWKDQIHVLETLSNNIRSDKFYTDAVMTPALERLKDELDKKK